MSARVCVCERQREFLNREGGEGRVGALWRPTGSLLGLHSLKLLFYKGACLAQRAGPARLRKERGGAGPVMDATVAEKNK